VSDTYDSMVRPDSSYELANAVIVDTVISHLVHMNIVLDYLYKKYNKCKKNNTLRYNKNLIYR